MVYHSAAVVAHAQITAVSSVSASPAPLGIKKEQRQHALTPVRAVKAAARHAYAHLLGHASFPSKRSPPRADLECFTRASIVLPAIRRPSASDLAAGVARGGTSSVL
ncbi:hypothetical protein T484DRAFT_1753370 [Baffinella frigidus]|nr:hypothetical protein T484DRAFT_1753370 [Cryptophyta sp. CCMP2293]